MATYKEINHDSSTILSDFYDSITDPDGGFSVLAAANLGSSTNGVRADYDAGNNLMFFRETIASFTTETTLSWRIRVNFSNLSNSSGIVSICAITLDDTSGSDPFGFTFRWNGSGTIQVSAFYLSDSGGTTSIVSDVSMSINSDVCLLIQATKETADGNADGEAEFFIDAVSQGSISDADNFNNFGVFDRVHCGFSSQNSTISGTFDYDEFLLDDTIAALCGAAAVNTFRFLGFDADNENLYASGLKDAATLQLFDYDLPTLTEAGTTSFGSGTDGELDALTRGIFPVIKPMADQVLYLRGRDGNNVQVQYNDQNGTLGWVDLGPGTATWGTAKYAAGLLTAPTYTDDVIAVFSDDDVYRTRFGTQTWVKMGDAGSGLRGGVRHASRFNEIMTGGTAAGTVEWSNNFGATFGDVSGTALGTINTFEVSL